MNENNKMRGFVKPFQNKGGSSWNLNLATVKISNDYINAEFLKGVSLWCNYDKGNRFIERTCSIDISDNPKYAEVVKALIDKFEGADTFIKYDTTSNNANKLVAYNSAGTALELVDQITNLDFSTDNFDVASDQEVTIKAGGVDLTAEVTGTLPLGNGGTGATTLAGANIVATNAQNTFTKAQLPSTYTGSSLTLDLDTYQNFILTLSAGSNTLANPSTEASQIGQSGVITLIQPSSGSAGTISLSSDWETAESAGLTLSSANNDYDVVAYFVKADNSILLSPAQLNFG